MIKVGDVVSINHSGPLRGKYGTVVKVENQKAWVQVAFYRGPITVPLSALKKKEAPVIEPPHSTPRNETFTDTSSLLSGASMFDTPSSVPDFSNVSSGSCLS